MTTNNKVSYSLTDKVLEVAGVASSIAIIVLPMVNYANLPTEIPTHFNFKGLPDAWGSKSSIWALPAIATVLYIGLSVLSYFLVIRKNANTPGSYTGTLRQVLHLMQALKLALNLGFLYIIYATIRVALGSNEGLGNWFLPVFLLLMTIMPLFFLVKIAGKPTTHSSK